MSAKRISMSIAMFIIVLTTITLQSFIVVANDLMSPTSRVGESVDLSRSCKNPTTKFCMRIQRWGYGFSCWGSNPIHEESFFPILGFASLKDLDLNCLLFMYFVLIPWNNLGCCYFISKIGLLWCLWTFVENNGRLKKNH